MGKKKNDSRSSGNVKRLTEELFKVLDKHPNRTFNYKQLTKQVKESYYAFRQEEESAATTDELHRELKQGIIHLLQELAAKGDLIETSPGQYKLKPVHAYMEGIIDIAHSGDAYLLSETDEEDIYIAPRNVKNALNGDRVKIYLYARHQKKRMEGEVVDVLERSKTEFVGTVQLSPRFAFLVPDSPKMLVDIFIPLNHLAGAQQGQKALATIDDWPKGTKNPIGKITQLLGWPGENDTEMNSILSEYGFPLSFPERVENEAAKIPDVIDEKEIARRKDFRKITTFTIDPEDAKDFDDALSIRQMDNGHWEIGVHIADVAHYIKAGSFLDKEAYSRATSVYLVDRVIPMLPEKLSNGVCSLRPNEDKLCFSAVFEMGEDGRIYSQWIGRTIIHSDKRFSYEMAQQVLETGKGEYVNELQTLNMLAKKLRGERFKHGAIEFEKMEVRFKLDEKGKPLGVYLKESKDAHKLIEEFMLLANRTVAETIGRPPTPQRGERRTLSDGLNSPLRGAGGLHPFVYRVHDSPVTEKLNNFAAFAGKWGYKLKTDNDKEISQSLNSLMKNLRGKKEQNVLEQLAIRTMSKAIYTTENIGHYGLAFDFYTHFTSPIRRYPDVMVHRLIEHYMNHKEAVDKDELEEKCKHSTQMEIRAAEAERASIKYKQVEFLQDKIGQVFDGIISGVTEWGIYVELVENKCEGMIRLRDLEDDFYEFDETNYCVIGNRTKNKYTMGDTVQVMVTRADLLRKQIDFKMVNDFAPMAKGQGGFSAKPRTHGDGFRKEKKKSGSDNRKTGSDNRKSGFKKKRW